MTSLDTFEKRLRDETVAVETEIEAHKQQLEALNERLAGLKRAAELCESEQGAISELLQAGSANGGVLTRGMPVPPTKAQRATTSQKRTEAQRWRETNAQERTNRPTGEAGRSASQNGGLTRVDMIAAVLKRHPRRTVRELI